MDFYFDVQVIASTVYVTRVELDSYKETLNVGGSTTIHATAYPTNATNRSVNWRSSDTSVATVSSGYIYAVSPGDATITCSAADGSGCYATCKVHVNDIEPTNASTGNYSVYADQSIDLVVNVSPSNATVKSTQWYVKSGSDNVSISGSRLKGIKPGTAEVYCMINSTLRSNDATVTVKEPSLSASEYSPARFSTGVSAFAVPAVTYSLDLYKGDDFNSVSLTGSEAVAGTATISGKTIRFTPSSPLKPLTTYTLKIPRTAVKNKWGSLAASDVTLTFTTGDLDKATVTMTPVTGSFLTNNDRVTLSATPSDAKIYYTTDGSDPTRASSLYTSPIKIDADVTVKALACREGYHDSNIEAAQYYKSQSEVMSYYPNDRAPLFNYSVANPHIILSGTVEKSSNFRRISLSKSTGESVDGQAYLTNNMIVFVHDEPLENATTYTLDIPRDAVKTLNGEVFKGFTWTFSTPNLARWAGMRSDLGVYVLAENGSLKQRGGYYSTYNYNQGSPTVKDYESLKETGTGVSQISTGYTHHLLVNDKGVQGSGLGYCGETGTASSISAIGEAKTVKAGFQTSAIIDERGGLWMCGRNDFYQLSDGSGTTQNSFIKVRDNVIDVALGNGYTLIVDGDNTLWAVGRNHKGQLGDNTTADRREPVKILDGVEKAYASTNGYFSACITTTGELMTWGDNGAGQLGRDTSASSALSPSGVISDAVMAALGEAHSLALTSDNKLYAWGANTHGQIGSAKSSGSSIPSLMKEDIAYVAAGPQSTVVTSLSGQVTGWGRKTHSNFGSGDGNATEYIVDAGAPCESLTGAAIAPGSHEAMPESTFALVAYPTPLAADFDTVEWTSSNPEIARVDENGVITTGALGEATITARFTDRYGQCKEATSKVISTLTPDNSGIDNIFNDNSNWRVYTRNLDIIVENATPGASYAVYDMRGIVVASTAATSDSFIIQVATPGIYIIRSGLKTVKLACH